MSDDPADFDPDDDPAQDWAQAQRTEVAPPVDEILADAIPEAVEPTTPRPDVTGRHNTLTPAQFASAIDLTDRDAFTRGVAHGDAVGYARGFSDGDAYGYARNVSETDAAEAVFAALRLALFTGGVEHGANFAEHVRTLIKAPTK